jgi:hypothetical protein
MASSDARPIPRKNVAYRVTFPIFDADGDLVPGAAGLDSEVSKDGGTFADCTNEATEIATNSGIYFLDLTSTEMNADTVAIIVKTSTSGAKTTPIILYPEEAGDVRVDVVQISGDTTAADNAESFFDGTGYAGTNNVIPTVSTVNALASGSITAAVVATGAIDADAIATDAVTEIQSGLATSANQTTILNRLGSFTGSGVNTVLGFFQALMRSDSTTPSDLGGTYDDATDSLQAIRDRGDAAWTTGTSLDAAGIRSAVGLASANLDTQLAAIESQTDDIGVAGAGLSAIPWNASWDAEVQSEVDDALVARGLDHLLNASVAGADIADNSIIAKLVSKSATADWDSYDNTSDSLEAISDGAGSGGLDAAGVRAAVGLASANLDTQLAAIDTNVDSILADTGTDGVVIATGGIVSTTFATSALNAIADAVLLRDWTSIISTVPARSMLNALRAIRNKWSIVLGVLTVTKEDDATTAWTANITTDSNAEGITGSDPT